VKGFIRAFLVWRNGTIVGMESNSPNWLLLAALKETLQIHRRGKQVEEISNTLNVNVYFSFLLHSAMLNKSGNNFLLIYFSFHVFDIN
jgi:hypothetical protein